MDSDCSDWKISTRIGRIARIEFELGNCNPHAQIADHDFDSFGPFLLLTKRGTRLRWHGLNKTLTSQKLTFKLKDLEGLK